MFDSSKQNLSNKRKKLWQIIHKTVASPYNLNEKTSQGLPCKKPQGNEIKYAFEGAQMG